MVTVTLNNQQDDMQVDEDSFRQLSSTILEKLEKPSVEIGAYLVDSEAICQIHEDHFGDSSFTDCMTFPIDQEDPLGYLGEIVICPKSALEFVKNNPNSMTTIEALSSKSFSIKEQTYIELSRYLIHTLLHLVGYQDDTDTNRAEMKLKEDQLLIEAINENLLLRD